METAAHVTEYDIKKLQSFHFVHFLNQDVPPLHLKEPLCEIERRNELGYYEDGVKRTLTDEQVKMFRHSEIQRLLAQRRARQQANEDNKSSEYSKTARQQHLKTSGTKFEKEGLGSEQLQSLTHKEDDVVLNYE